jgi:hypothetical protein
MAIGNPAFRAEYLRLTSTIVAPIARELSRLDADRHPDIDFELLSYVVMGMAEAGARTVHEGRHSAESAWRYLEPVLAELTRRASLIEGQIDTGQASSR